MTTKRRPGPLVTTLGVFFVLAGAAKIVGIPYEIDRFATWQMPRWWVVYVIGILEVVGAGLLWFPRTRAVGVVALFGVTTVLLSAQVRLGLMSDVVVSTLLLGGLFLAVRRGRTTAA